MLKSKIIDVLKTFSAEEMKSFRNFVISPFHNKNRNVVKLFDLLRKCYPGFSTVSLVKEALFKKLYPGKKYSDIVMRILLSDLLRLSEEFLAYKSFTSSGIDEERFLLKELQSRKLDSLFVKHIRELEGMLDAKGLIDGKYFMEKYELENTKVNYLISRDRQNESGTALLKQSEHLLEFFLYNSFNIVQELSEQKEVLNEKFETNPAEEFFRNINLKDFMETYASGGHEYKKIIEISYLMYLSSIEQADAVTYDKLFSLVKENTGRFTEAERFNLFLGLESCCLIGVSAGGELKNSRLMEVYELMLASGALSSSGRENMQANLFRNIFYTAVVLKRYGWAEEFAEKYIGKLVPEQHADMYNYTKALLNFERRNFESALEQISKVNYGFFVFKFEAKVLMLKLYYELRSFEPALSLVDSFTHFLTKNKKVSELYKETFMSFLKYLKALIKLSRDPNKTGDIGPKMLLKKISGENQLLNKRWIIEKTNELISGK